MQLFAKNERLFTKNGLLFAENGQLFSKKSLRIPILENCIHVLGNCFHVLDNCFHVLGNCFLFLNETWWVRQSSFYLLINALYDFCINSDFSKAKKSGFWGVLNESEIQGLFSSSVNMLSSHIIDLLWSLLLEKEKEFFIGKKAHAGVHDKFPNSFFNLSIRGIIGNKVNLITFLQGIK